MKFSPADANPCIIQGSPWADNIELQSEDLIAWGGRRWIIHAPSHGDHFMSAGHVHDTCRRPRLERGDSRDCNTLELSVLPSPHCDSCIQQIPKVSNRPRISPTIALALAALFSRGRVSEVANYLFRNCENIRDERKMCQMPNSKR